MMTRSTRPECNSATQYDTCASGYSGDAIRDRGCSDIDDCAGNPCREVVDSCTDTGTNDYSCACDTGPAV